MRSRGKQAVLILLGAALAASGVFAWVSRDHLQDYWWLWRLRSADAATRLDAARRLGARKSLRAVPEIVRLIALDPREDVTWHMELEADLETGRTACGSGLHYRKSTPLVLVLWDMGEAALPIIDRSSCRMSAGGEKMRRIFRELSHRDVPLDFEHEVVKVLERLKPVLPAGVEPTIR